MTVAELCDAYLADAEAGRLLTWRGQSKKRSTLAVDRERIERHFKPLLGSRAVAAVTRADIEQFMFAQRCAERRIFLVAQPPLAPAVGKANDAMNRVVRSQSAAHRVGEDRAKQPHRSGCGAAATTDTRKPALLRLDAGRGLALSDSMPGSRPDPKAPPGNCLTLTIPFWRDARFDTFRLCLVKFAGRASEMVTRVKIAHNEPLGATSSPVHRVAYLTKTTPAGRRNAASRRAS